MFRLPLRIFRQPYITVIMAAPNTLACVPLETFVSRPLRTIVENYGVVFCTCMIFILCNY